MLYLLLIFHSVIHVFDARPDQQNLGFASVLQKSGGHRKRAISWSNGHKIFEAREKKQKSVSRIQIEVKSR